jgi:cellulose synthase/poly-beta-1,6-N-acetylglucosamine synthase-like glycosyltransferase
MHDQKTKISILIPCYNAERWVGQAIESALVQTWPNKEVIVVDDGSTDESRAVIESYGDKIRYEFGPNRGGNPCRNRLLELASGEWVQFLDADDYLLPEKISDQMEFSHSADVIYGPVLIKNQSSRCDNQEVSLPSSNSDLFEHWICWQVCQTGGVLWRRDALCKIGGWNEAYRCCQDNEVCLRAIQHGLKFSYCPKSGAVYRIWSEDTVCRKNPREVIATKTALIEEMLKWLKDSGLLHAHHTLAAGQAAFEMARTLAKFSISEASRYAEAQKSKGIWNPVGPSAPIIFCRVMDIFGYFAAELFAHSARVLKKA